MTHLPGRPNKKSSWSYCERAMVDQPVADIGTIGSRHVNHFYRAINYWLTSHEFNINNHDPYLPPLDQRTDVPTPDQ